jgi:hypothetical protein
VIGGNEATREVQHFQEFSLLIQQTYCPEQVFYKKAPQLCPALLNSVVQAVQRSRPNQNNEIRLGF